MKTTQKYDDRSKLRSMCPCYIRIAACRFIPAVSLRNTITRFRIMNFETEYYLNNTRQPIALALYQRYTHERPNAFIGQQSLIPMIQTRQYNSIGSWGYALDLEEPLFCA